MRRNAAVVGGKLFSEYFSSCFFHSGRFSDVLSAEKFFRRNISVDILPKVAYIIFEVSFTYGRWVIGTLPPRAKYLTSFFVQMQDAIISYCILYCVLDITFRVCQINKNRCPKQWKYTLNTHNETNLICQRAENPCISSIL